MNYVVESTQGLKQGDEFMILDIQPGDEFSIPVKTQVVFSNTGKVAAKSVVDVEVLVDGKKVELFKSLDNH